MTMQLGQSMVLPANMFQPPQSITKKISNWIFRLEDKIGQGNFSKVYRGFHQLTNEQVAIKIIELSSLQSAKLQELLFSEIQVIQSLNHPNILKCHQVLKSQNNCYIITQLCNEGDLQSLLKRQKCLNQSSAGTYVRDIYKGLLYLGQRGIVHRDLKIANIFMHNGICKIADFGFAKYTNNQNFLDLDIGSPLYMSPQGMIDHLYGMKTDIWSFGVIIYELLHGKTPFQNCSSEYDLKRTVLIPISYHNLRVDLSPEVKQLMLSCLNINLANRPDALSLVNDTFLKNVLLTYNQTSLYIPPTSQNFIHQTNIQQINHVQPFIQGNAPMNNNQFRRVQISLSQENHLNLMPVKIQQPLIYYQHQILNQQNQPYNQQYQPLNQQNQPYNQQHQLLNQQNQHLNQQNQPYNQQYEPLNQHQHLNLNQHQILSQHQPLNQHQFIIQQNQPSNQRQSLNQQQLLNQHQFLNPQNQLLNHQHQYLNQQQPLKQAQVQNQHNPKLVQFNNSSPNKAVNRSNQKQSLMHETKSKKKNRQTNINIKISGKQFHNSSSSSQCYPKSNDNIRISNNSYIDLLSPTRYPINQIDYILAPQQLQDKNSKSMRQSNDDKTSNSSWSHLNITKNKFPKILSYQNFSKVNYNLVENRNVPGQVAEGQRTSYKNINNSHKPSLFQRSYEQSQNLNESRDFSMTEPAMAQKPEIKQLYFKGQLGGQTIKFGKVIKGQRQNGGTVNPTAKMVKLLDNPQNLIQRTKTKSHISYEPAMINSLPPFQKKRLARHSIGLIQTNTHSQGSSISQSFNQSNHGINQASNQLIDYSPIYPSTAQNRTNSQSSFLRPNAQNQPPHNVICTVIQFKQAVGFLHYCRLYFRFITTWRKLMLFPQISKYQQFDKLINKKQHKNEQIYSRYLLTVLSQLIMKVRSKEIIYDGQNYKKKKIKEDKLKEVIQKYFKKYQEQINKSRVDSDKLLPVYDETTSIQCMKAHNQQIWGVLDQDLKTVVQLCRKSQDFPQVLVKQYRNLCYFSIRIIEANQIVANCIHTKSYLTLAETLIQNWLSQQFFGQQRYIQLKSQYLGETSDSSALKSSQRTI